jgi:hypothetical protein
MELKVELNLEFLVEVKALVLIISKFLKGIKEVDCSIYLIKDS